MSAHVHGIEQPQPGWPLLVTAVPFALIGLACLVGGAWLLRLGGSAYYLIAGAAMTATAWLLWRRRNGARHLYALFLLGTTVWAVVEVGLDWWQLVPRIDVVVVLGLLLLPPWISRRLHGGRVAGWKATAPLWLALMIALVVALLAMTRDTHRLDGELPGARVSVPARYGDVPDDDWSAYGRSWRGNKWSPLAQITPRNVRDLEVAWQVRTGDTRRPTDPPEFTYEVTPIKVDDTLYLCTPHNHVLALDAETGHVRWRFDPGIRVSQRMQHLTCRGVSYHDARWPGAARAADGECPQRILMATNDARLIALDARTGKPCARFGDNGSLNLWPGMPAYQEGWFQFTSAPLVTRGLVVVGGAIYDNISTHVPSGVIRAFDVVSGRLVWNFDPGHPDDTAPLPPGRRYSWSSPNSWSTSAADESLGLIYVPMGNGAIDQWGGRRPPTTERFSSSVLALDIATGRLRWVFQTVHHDLWDMDVPAQPALIDLTLPGRGTVPALVQVTKTGNLFVLDRRTGQPVHPVREQPVPQGPAPGDWTSPTQPVSSVTVAPPRPVREADMWGATMLGQMVCRIHFKRLRYEGPFTPPSLQGTLVFPGNFGVMDWGGMAVDPVRQVAFAHPNYLGFVDRLVPRQRPGEHARQRGPAGASDRGGSSEHGLNPNLGAPFAVELNPFLSPVGLPCQAPPWGYVAGVDLVTGKVVWQRRNGTIRDESPVPVPFKLGVPSLGGPIMTAGGVAFMGSTLDYYLRAYDVTTGEQLWQARLPAGGQATPMTYRSAASGRQFVVIVAGGHGSLGTKLGDHVIAYALPKGEASR
ncbi:membrane-bound PQQ-dependent dehydrogenase, glucose/quinate/shikimate family [Lysobacter sp.]|uniref:membrane-bound PQQ-dependent dehydrogenase, glucose/quinate/shikimate family n=1 Tax=Lysobacter sp. TaxID=72226 RepID=UPI002D71979D|nr:membrane-bound PQQ-dependent dehydrogenase, glucose/quinate/shikimate family [Lysobacter sp.]HZX78632.1 membrane-bound PQQ-dependent dehydrogenase, glucose/quinate/shikimate family [Lysobacter sp.]